MSTEKKYAHRLACILLNKTAAAPTLRLLSMQLQRQSGVHWTLLLLAFHVVVNNYVKINT